MSRSGNNNWRRSKPAPQQDQQPAYRPPEAGTQADWAMVRLTRWIIGFTAVTAFIAIGATVFAGLQWRASERATQVAIEGLRLQQTPRVRLWTGDLVGFDDGKPIGTLAHIKNMSALDIIDAKVWTAQGFAPVAAVNEIWTALQFRGPVTMGPDDEETYLIAIGHLEPGEAEALADGRGYLVVATKIQFTGADNRLHERYICSLYNGKPGAVRKDTCHTPPQR